MIGAITRHVRAQPAPGVRAEVRADPPRIPAYTIPASHPAIAAATAALEAVYPGQRVLLACIPGTLPAAHLFERKLGAKTLFFSFSAADEKLHAPNEFLQARRAEALLRGSLVISLHDHPVRFPARMEQAPEYNRTGRQHAAYAGLAASGMTVVFDNMMDGTACVTGNAPWRWHDIITDLGMRLADLAHAPGFMAVRTVADIDEAHRSGRVGLVFGLESATPVENEIDRLDVLYGLGIRQIGIAYSDANALGSGLAEGRDGGLTAFGRRAVARMNRLGLAIDLSHCSDRTALDVCEHTEAPVFITHAGARAVWDTRRMKPDGVLRAVARTGGVIGMSAAPHTTLSAAHPRHTIDSVMDHFRYCLDLVGAGHVAFGPDTLYGDHVRLHTVFAHLLSLDAMRGPSFDPVGYVDGLENPTENFGNICGWLVGHGFDDATIRAVIGGNVYRALRSVWIAP